MKIGIAWPHTNQYYDKLFVETFFCMDFPIGVDRVLLTPNSSGPLDSVRNELVQQALMYKCTHIFWCDTDQVYPVDTFKALILHDLPIVCAKVHRRRPPYDPLLKRVNPDKQDKQNPYIDVEPDEWAFNLAPLRRPTSVSLNRKYPLVEVDATGFGCNLIDMNVFDGMERPWFKFEIDTKPPIGEDIYFWRKVKEMGYKVYVDVSIDIGHITAAVVKQNTFMEYRKSFSEG